MPLSSGEQLGNYKILSMIGKGGMGEVYLGTDTRLGRSVAVKASSREFNAAIMSVDVNGSVVLNWQGDLKR
jgi:serine/threonine protein kinase